MATTRNSGGRSLRLENFSDRELLALVRDHEDGEGWADSLHIAEQIWPRYTAEEPKNARLSVARRFSYLKSKGVMERGDRGLWRLTDQGRQIVEGQLTAQQTRALLNLEDEKLMSLGYVLSDRYQMAGDASAILFRRAMQFAQHQRKRGVR